MRAISNHRIRYRTAMAMLLVWLFALASGVVNACVLDNTGISGYAPTGASVPATPSVQVAAIATKHLGVVASHDDASHPSKPLSPDACDEVSPSLVIKTSSAPDLTNPGLASYTAIFWIAPPGVAAAPRRGIDAGPPPAGPPARLRFSRMAL